MNEPRDGTCEKLLDAITVYKLLNNGCAPSVRWLTAKCRLGSTSTASSHLGHLEDDGLIVRGQGACQIKLPGSTFEVIADAES